MTIEDVIRVVLIEDEPLAMDLLEKRLHQAIEQTADSLPYNRAVVVGRARSCEEASEVLRAQSHIDLILCDIQLSDGLALSIFDEVPPTAPLIFCTAHDQFVLEALTKGGVDYLLKPVRAEDVARALGKLATIEARAKARTNPPATMSALRQALLPTANATRRFVVKRGADFVAVELDDVAYFLSEHKLTLLVQRDGATAYLDDSLNALEEDLRAQGADFFRANRSLLVAKTAVVSFRGGLKGKLELKLTPASNKDASVSAANAAAFKTWFAAGRVAT